MPDLFLEIRAHDDDEGTTPALPLCEEDALQVLRESEIIASKLIPWGSNYSFAVALEMPDGKEHLAIYKPRSGEAPLYDFPDGTLYLRETAAYVLSKQLNWNFVPPTVIRDGPHGIGSLQIYVEPFPESQENNARFWESCNLEVERLVLFDYVSNNADRKLGHCLRDYSGKIWGIDHGLTFNQYPKMRTVLWQFLGERISPALIPDLERLLANKYDVRNGLKPFISIPELDALFARTERLVETRQHPVLNPRRNIPYGWW
ncbi:MAG: hypothetical protein ACJ789_01850 [Thermomicrobiales bacterium]